MAWWMGVREGQDTQLHRLHTRAWFDVGALKFPLWVGAMGEAASQNKALREALRARGVPKALWRRIWGVGDGGGLLWVPGVWRSKAAMLANGTEAGLVVEATGLPWFLEAQKDG